MIIMSTAIDRKAASKRGLLVFLCLAVTACAAAPKQAPPPGAQWFTATSAFNATFARNKLDNKVAAACPDGHEIIDERSAIGWTAEVSKLVRCL